MKRITKLVEVVFILAMIMLCVLVFMAGRGKVPYVFGYRVLQVITDSMKPAISDETCIIIKRVDCDDIQVGDIITYTSEDPRIKGFLNTHRVVEIKNDEETGERLFVTKGDAVQIRDPYLVRYDQVAGRYVREMPFGRFIYKTRIFLADQVNYFVVVMLPLFLCFMSYVRQLIKALFSKEEDADE